MKLILQTILIVALTGSAGLWAQKSTSDDQLYDQVRLKLAEDPGVNGGALQVEVKGGVVTVKGRVRTDKARQKAERIIRKVKGVKNVDNQLQVDPNAH